MENIEIINWNVRGFKARFEEIKMLIYEYDPIVLCLQELMTNLPYVPKIKGYKSIISAGAKAAIFIKDGYFFEEINLNTNMEAVGIKIKLKKVVSVVSIYLPPHERIVRSELNSMLNSLSGNFIITGDFNARSELWGDSITNTRGRIVENFCLQNDLFVANNGQATHVPHISAHSFSAIDLTIVNSAFGLEVDWQLEEDARGSDHIPILISCKMKTKKLERIPKFIFEKADWNQFDIDADLSNLNFDENSENILEQILSIITDAANNNIPKTKSKITRRCPPWLTNEIKTLINKRKNLQKKFKNRINLENLLAFKKSSAKATFEIKKAKKEGWIKYVESINEDTSIKEFWRKINVMDGKTSSFGIKHMIDSRNEGIDDPKVMADELAKHYHKVSSSDEYCPQFTTLQSDYN